MWIHTLFLSCLCVSSAHLLNVAHAYTHIQVIVLTVFMCMFRVSELFTLYIWTAHTNTSKKNENRTNTLNIYTECARMYVCRYLYITYINSTGGSEWGENCDLLSLTKIHTFNCALTHTYSIHIRRSIVQLPAVLAFERWTQSDYVSKCILCVLTNYIHGCKKIMYILNFKVQWM